MKLGTAQAEKGKITKGHVELGHYPDGPMTSPVMIANGMSDGPTLWVQAGIHGPEVIGQLSIARFLKTLDLKTLKGRIVCLMVANPLGFRGYSRLTPQDGMNINRIFPGKKDGTISEQLARRLLDITLPVADFILDLHSGGDLTITPFYVIFAKGEGAASKRAKELSEKVGSRLQWGSNEDWMQGAALTHYAKGGKPALIVESGGGARVWEEDFANMKIALNGLCQALDMIPGKPPQADNIRYGGNAVHLKAQSGGFWHPLVAPGQDVIEGQPLGNMVDIWGDVVETTTCVYKRGWIGSIRRPYMPIYNGDQIIELVESVPVEKHTA